MRIMFIGTSHGIPQPGRRCSCTLVEAGGRMYLVDLGTMVTEVLAERGLTPECIGAVFLTHMHGDHINGLPAFVDQIAWAWKNANPEIFLPEPEAAVWLENWIAMTSGREKTIRWRSVEEGLLFDDGVMKVTAFRNCHTDRSFSFLLEAEGKHVLFTGDLKNPGLDFPRLPENIVLDLVVGEASHFPAQDWDEPCRKYGIRQLCLNHCSPKKLPETRQWAEVAAPLPVTLAADGMELNL